MKLVLRQTSAAWTCTCSSCHYMTGANLRGRRPYAATPAPHDNAVSYPQVGLWRGRNLSMLRSTRSCMVVSRPRRWSTTPTSLEIRSNHNIVQSQPSGKAAAEGFGQHQPIVSVSIGGEQEQQVTHSATAAHLEELVLSLLP